MGQRFRDRNPFESGHLRLSPSWFHGSIFYCFGNLSRSGARLAPSWSGHPKAPARHYLLVRCPARSCDVKKKSEKRERKRKKKKKILQATGEGLQPENGLVSQPTSLTNWIAVLWGVQNQCFCNADASAALVCRSVVGLHRVFTSRMASSLSSRPTLSGFPLLTAEEFETACHAFLDRIHVVDDTKVGWSSIRLDQRVS